MSRLAGFTHQTGVHCGATTLSNVAEYYGWNYSEAACFGIGGGAAFVRYDGPAGPRFRASPLWLERAFFERLRVPHVFQRGDAFENALADVSARIERGDPVMLFLDPAALPYLEQPAHVGPHVVAAIGYDDDTLELSDPSQTDRVAVSTSTLAEAWQTHSDPSLLNEYLAVTSARIRRDRNDAAAAGLRQAGSYMLTPLEIKRNARRPGEEGLPALRAYGDFVESLPDRQDRPEQVAGVLRTIDEHGDGTAYRRLYADALDELAQHTNLPGAIAGRTREMAEEWATVARLLDDPGHAGYEEAASLVADIADQEATIFRTLLDELGAPSEQ